jgi:hypothetical protein
VTLVPAAADVSIAVNDAAWLCPTLNPPTSQLTFGAENVHWLELSKLSPAGRRSVMSAPVSSGPRFVAVSVNVSESPTDAAGAEMALMICRSATGATPTRALAVLLVVSGSGSALVT